MPKFKNRPDPEGTVQILVRHVNEKGQAIAGRATCSYKIQNAKATEIGDLISNRVLRPDIGWQIRKK